MAVELPLEPQIRWLVRQSALLLSFGAEPVRGLVTPTGEYFPDPFDGSPGSVGRLLGRVQHHAGLRDLDIELVLVTPEGQAQSVSCSSGACGGTGVIEARSDRVARRGDGAYSVTVGTGEIKNPVVLTTALVRAVATMFVVESGALDEIPAAEREPAIDLAAVLLGFGVLVANGSYIYAKGCGGVNVHSATRMPVDEVTLALAVFCKYFDVDPRLVTRHLELTQREHFDESLVWASSNDALVRMLKSDRDALVEDNFRVSPARSWLARVLGVGRSKASKTSDDDLAELERALASRTNKPSPESDPHKARRLEEIRALVDENLEA